MTPQRIDELDSAKRQAMSRLDALLDYGNALVAERRQSNYRKVVVTRTVYFPDAAVDEGENYMLASPGGTRLMDTIDAAPTTEMVKRDGAWRVPPVEIQEPPTFLDNVKAGFNREDASSFHEPDMDHAEPHDTPGQRVPTPPGAKEEEQERADWDRLNDGDRFE
jgi:hypothetical protein